jgi:uncharacterized protein (TIGR03083 family)
MRAMADPRTDLDRATTSLHRQWDTLRLWLGDLVADDAVDLTAPSVLPGWTVAELVAHLGRAMDALTAVRPAPPGTTPLAVGTYLGAYAAGAADIAETTRTLAAGLSPDLLGGVDAMVRGAFEHLDRLTSDEGVVMARRGPMSLADMVLTRVIELVVHADDLARSVDRPGRPPLDAGALDLVAQGLLDVLVARGGWTLEVADPLRWVRLAAGRAPYDVDELALALRAPATADAVPDLGRELPLL